MTSAVIVDIIRTGSGKGKPGGALSEMHPAVMLSQVIRLLVERNGLDPQLVDDVIAGCVGQVGDQSLNIARTAVLHAGFPESVPGTTIDRQCGSSQQAAHFAAQAIISGAQDIVIAGGVESMSRVPMGAAALPGTDPQGPLAERYPAGLAHQGIGAELIAARRNISREELDAFSARSHERAAVAFAEGAFADEMVSVTLPGGSTHLVDETVRPTTTAAGLAGLTSAFYNEQFAKRFPEITWAITPGNSSPLTDGASAALIMSEEKAAELGLKPRARFHTFAVSGSDPLVMLDGVIPATKQALAKSGLSIGEIDAYEVNEAFAPVPLAWAREFGADEAKLNPRGGAIALGHPLGGSGTRLMATMVNYLEQTGGRYGLQTMCEGGGMANATIIERI
ncbi:acetyl-CoA C-acyltransferase [Gordonia humi]|uniref:Acetyl-CoA acyltransferase n=1 Tax=Gordonia humi TaxID=686429 RepID=A0A840EU62_9ACTN|nr:acetyl-CoA acyltransferase [Gordonia humi]